MVGQLLVPLDGSGFGEETIPIAASIARSTGADVTVAHVHVPHVPDHLVSNTQYMYEGLDLAEYDDRDCEEELDYLDGVARRLEGMLGREVDPVLLEGEEVSGSIEAWIEGREGSGLVVMATHGRSGFSRAWLGSVADTLVRHAPWPVLLVRPPVDRSRAPAEGFQRVLVPLDGSTGAERILPHVVELVQDTAGAVALLRVVSTSHFMGTSFLPISEAALAEERRRAARYLEEVADRLRRRDVPVRTEVVDGVQPFHAILEWVEEESPDLVAMATHGYRGVTRAVLGSVADKVLRGCSAPLLLLGPGVVRSVEH